MNFIQNTWFVGISTGIISGILVFILTKWIMDKSGKTEYYKQVANANHNVINSLKPYIADQGLPTTDIFNAIISSTAREYGVDEKNMYSIDVYCEELIREIISDVYVSNEKKSEYVDSLAEYKKRTLKLEKTLSETKKIDSSGTYYKKMKDLMSIYTSVLTALLSSLAIILEPNPHIFDANLSWFSKNTLLSLLIFLILLILLLVIWIKLIKSNRTEEK